MSKAAIKTLKEVLDGAESIDRRDAYRVLKYLGFKPRQSGGNHQKWQRPDTPEHITFSKQNHLKVSDKLWGYDMQSIRRVVKAALALQPVNLEREKEDNKMPKNNTVIKMHEPTPIEIVKKPVIRCLGPENFPDDVGLLAESCLKKEIKVVDLVKLLNESGYRTLRGLYSPQATFMRACSIPVRLKNGRPEQGGLPEPLTPPESKKPTTEIANAVPFDAGALVGYIHDIVAENKRLKEQLAAIRALVEVQ